MSRLILNLLRGSGSGRLALSLLSILAITSSLLAALPPLFLGATAGVVAQGPIAIYSPVSSINSLFTSFLPQEGGPRALAFCAAGYLCILLISLLVRNVYAVWVSLCTDKLILHVREKCLEAVLRSDKKALSRFESGDIMHRIMGDTRQLDYIIGMPLYTIVSDSIDLLCLAVFIALMDWKILLLLLGIFPVLYLISRRTGRIQKALARDLQTSEAASTGFIQRSALGLDTIKAFRGEARESGEFEAICLDNYQARKKSSINLGLFFPQEGFLRGLGSIGAVGYASMLALTDPAYVSAIPVLIIYTQKFYAPLSNWAKYYAMLQRGIVSLQRIAELLSVRQEPAAPHEAGPEKLLYPIAVKGSTLLEDGRKPSLSLRLEKPDLVIVRGKSGAGKTRLMKSMLSLGCDFEGTLEAGGRQFRAPGMASARRLFAYAAQDSHFFPGTIAENLAYPVPVQAIDRERCQEILGSMGLQDMSLDAEVEEFGRNLSLGEQRRLILGRAVYADGPILVLDEIDANVDMDTRRKIYSLVAREKSRRSILMITHANPSELEAVEHRTAIIA